MDRIPVQLVVDYKMSTALILSFIYWSTEPVRRSHLKELMQWTDEQVTTVVGDLVSSGMVTEVIEVLHLGQSVMKYFEPAEVHKMIVAKMEHITPSPTNFSRRDFSEKQIDAPYGVQDPDIQVQVEVASWFKSGQKEVPTDLLARVQRISKDYIKCFCTNKIKMRVGAMVL